jgi:transcriptional regulator GlxA family with amidase domain
MNFNRRSPAIWIPFISSLIHREIVYRLLQGPQGDRLRAIATVGDQTQKTAKAIAWLRTNYTKPLRLEALAELSRMGISTLHHHFRALTAMSQSNTNSRFGHKSPAIEC